jgi:hypothetical protein
MPRQSKDTVAILGIDIGKNTFLYVFSPASQEGSGAGDGSNAGTFLSRADSPGATKHFFSSSASTSAAPSFCARSSPAAKSKPGLPTSLPASSAWRPVSATIT